MTKINHYYLYQITNLVNSKSYIGITNNPKRRWQSHTSPHSTCTLIRKAIQKYGKQSFSFKVLCVGEEEYIKDLEIKAICSFGTLASNGGYNLHLGNPRDGRLSLPNEVKSKISDGLREYYRHNESANKGRKVAHRSDHSPIYFDGFWFPSIKCCREALNIPKTTLYRKLRSMKNRGEVFGSDHSPLIKE